MIVKVKSRENPCVAPSVYDNVKKVVDCFDSNGNYCHRLLLEDGQEVTYPACEWKFYELKFVEMF